VPQHSVIAYMWLNLSAGQGDEFAKDGKNIIVEVMTSAEISKAQALSRECLAQNYKNCGY